MIVVAAPRLAPAQGADGLKPDDRRFPLSSVQVAQIQELLGQLGYNVGSENGTVGPHTVQSAKALAGLLEQEFVRKPSGHEIVLNCQIQEGVPAPYKSITILIDEYRKILIYNYQLNPDPDPIHVIGSGNQKGYIDLSMKISRDTNKFI